MSICEFYGDLWVNLEAIVTCRSRGIGVNFSRILKVSRRRSYYVRLYGNLKTLSLYVDVNLLAIWFLVSNLMHLFIISFHIPLHVSSHIVLIIKRIYCIYTGSGSLCVTLLVWPFGAQAVRNKVGNKKSNITKMHGQPHIKICSS